MAAYNSGGGTLENIIESTRRQLMYDDSKKHITTSAERTALRVLQQFGSLFIKGKSGSGKSNISLQLLKRVSADTGRIPLILTSPTQWNMFPKSGSTKYIVMLDNIFGSSNLVQPLVDKWLSLFNVMWPIVEKGHVFLVLTSRPDVYDQCANQVKSNTLMQGIQCVNLDKDTCKLRVNEKKRFLKVICRLKSSSLTKQVIDEIALATDASIGFPQCCHFFAASRQAQSHGKMFFYKPFELLAQEVNILEESDPIGYFVLLLVMMLKGQMDIGLLESLKPSEHFQEIVQAMYDISKLGYRPSRACLKHKALSLCGIYLVIQDRHCSFSHQSIFDVLFLKVATLYHEKCLRVCPAMLLVEKVRTEQLQEPHCEEMIILPSESYGLLAEKITDLMMSEECIDVLGHPSLQERNFVDFIFQKWLDENLLSKLLGVRLSQTLPADVHAPLKHKKDIVLFECDKMLSCMTLKGNTELVCLLLPFSRAYLHPDALAQVLACAIYTSHNKLCGLLLTMGVVPDNSSFRALCVASHDLSLLDAVVFSPNVKYVSMADFPVLFTIATLKGHKQLIELILKNGTTEHLAVFSECVKLLADVFSAGGTKHYEIYTIDETYEAIFEQLLRTGCKVDPEHLLICAAGHVSPAALRCIFKVYPHVNVDKMWETVPSTALEEALEHGGVECASLLLEHGASISVTEAIPSKATVFHMAAKSKHQSCEKLNILYATLVSVHQITAQSTTREAGESELSKRITCLVNRHDFLARTPLHNASFNGNAKSVKFLISIGAEVDAKDDENGTPLHLAVTADTFECIHALLEAKASVKMEDSFGYTPLSLPFRKSKHTTHALLDAGSDINHQGRGNVTCLYAAVESGDIENVRLLCSKGANVQAEVLFEAAMRADIDIVTQLFETGAKADITDETNSSLVHIAAMSDTDPVEKLVYLLREQHAPVDVVDQLGRTALFSGIFSKDAEVVEVLLEQQFNYKHVDKYGCSVLHELCANQKYSDNILEVLTKFGSDFLDMQDPCGKTALHCTVQNDRAEGTQMLLERGAKHSIQDIGGMTALHLAAICQSIDCLNLLLHFKADPYIKDAQNRTALHYLAMSSEMSIIEQLENICSFVNEVDEDGWTALHFAAKSGTTETIRYLLAKGADPSVLEHKGKTALHVGCEEANYKVLDILLQDRSAVSMLDNDMRSPLHLAALSGCSFAVELLLENGADPCIKDIEGRNPLHLAALKSIDSNCVKLLLRLNVDPCEGDINGDTPLHLVCKSRITSNDLLLHQMGIVMDALNSLVKIGRKGQREMAYKNLICGVNLFLENGANPNIQNQQGQTPLHYSAQRGHRECVEQLLRYGADSSLRDAQNRTPLHYALAAIKTWSTHCRKWADEYMSVVKKLFSIYTVVYDRHLTPLDGFLSLATEETIESEGEESIEYDDPNVDVEEYKKEVTAILQI